MSTSLGNMSKADRAKYSALLLKKKERKEKTQTQNTTQQKQEFETQLNRIALSYYNFKLTHTGIVSYKGFDNCTRHISSKSLINLKNYNPDNENNMFSNIPFDSCLGYLNSEKEVKRQLTEKQSKEVKKYCNKLSYYSGIREFKSRKSGNYKFKVSFLTLTAPTDTEIPQFLKAFELFLDYLRRTANCVYVWKKEFGKKGEKLHVHIMLNNFIPYYIVDWKWKRLLIAQGVNWPTNEKGKQTSSHYRIEIPKNPKQVGGYLSKYMGKINYCKENIGYLWGKSKILTECKETVLIESEIPNSEIFEIYKKYKTIGTEWVKICLVDLKKIQKLAPELYNIFMNQFFDFQSKITLPQRFQTV